MVTSLRALVPALAAAACGVEPVSTTGGTDEPLGPCGRGVVVAGGDDGRQSSNVSLVAWDGRVLAGSVVSSSSRVEALSVPLGGDVAFPSQPMLGDRIAVLDRHPSGVITWVAVRTGRVEAQLSVSTGFPANPHDYVEIAPDRAYVPRFDVNGAPGREPFDGGGDVLVVDPSARRALGRIDLAPAIAGESSALHPRGDRAVSLGDRVLVVVQAISRDYLSSASDRIVAIDVGTDRIAGTTALGFAGCSGIALHPGRAELALACTGAFDGDAEPSLDSAGVLVLDVSGPVREVRRFPAAPHLGAPPGFGIDWAGDDTLMLTTLGSQTRSRPDAVWSLDVSTGDATVLAEMPPFAVEAVACAAACGACFVADASAGVLARWDLGATPLEPPREIVVERRIGLSPRQLGKF